LVWVGVEMWRSRGSLAILEAHGDTIVPPARRQLASQGFITAIANPKGWAFFIALPPPFLNFNQPLSPQISALVSIMLTMELYCLALYASSGSAARSMLSRHFNVRLLNRISGTLITGIGIWLALD